MQKPKVSVVMPVYNGEAYVLEAITSILNQTFTDFELIVINDGSTDNTAAILKKLRDIERIKILNNTVNEGLIFTRNKAIINCNGSYIALLDSDDVAKPNRLEKQVRFLEANPDYALIGSNIDIISGEGKYLYTQNYNIAPDFIPSILLFQNYFAQSAVMIRKSALPKEIYRSQFPLSEDYDLWVRIASQNKVGNIAESLVNYRLHGSNISYVKAIQLQESYKNIIKQQLEKLGVSASEAELNMHVGIGLLEVPADKEFVIKAEEWLLKLREANAKTKIYQQQIFGKVTAKKWFDICKASRLGLWSYIKLVKSPLMERQYLTYLLKAKIEGKLF